MSRVSAEIDAPAVPLSPAARAALAADPAALATVLSGGDDYEILATVRPARAALFAAEAKAAGVTVTRIGTILAGARPPVVLDGAGRAIRLARAGHTHF